MTVTLQNQQLTVQIEALGAQLCSVKNAAGQEGRVLLKEDLPPRPLPTFENALEPKKVVDETDVYSKPVEQKQRFEEWSLDAPVTEAKAEMPAATAAAEPTAPTPPPGT